MEESEIALFFLNKVHHLLLLMLLLNSFKHEAKGLSELFKAADTYKARAKQKLYG